MAEWQRLEEDEDDDRNFCCTICAHTVRDVKQCKDCDELYCDKCFYVHQIFNVKSVHTVTHLTKTRNKPTRKCQEHDEENVTRYCINHGFFCCEKCNNHKNCVCINDVQQGLETETKLKASKKNIKSTLRELKEENSSCEATKTAHENDRKASTDQVNDFSESLIKRINELKEKTIAQVNLKHEKQSDEAEKDEQLLGGKIPEIEQYLENLDKQSRDTVFQKVIEGKRHNDAGRSILKQVHDHRKAGRTFVLKTNVQRVLKDIPSLGNFVDDMAKHYKINDMHDTKVCNSHGSCLLPDGTVVVTDWNNNRLKRLDASNYKVTDISNMSGKPWGVTCTSPDEVAVTLPVLKKIQFVSIRDYMYLTRSFSTSGVCNGIIFSNGELFVACGSQTNKAVKNGNGYVAVYSLDGLFLRKIPTDAFGTNPYHITASPDGTMIYVAQDECVVASDRNGEHVLSFTDPSLHNARGLCACDNGQLLVCCQYPHRVVQIDCDGGNPTTLLAKINFIMDPQSLCYDENTSRFIVTMKDTDQIKVCSLTKANSEDNDECCCILI